MLRTSRLLPGAVEGLDHPVTAFTGTAGNSLAHFLTTCGCKEERHGSSYGGAGDERQQDRPSRSFLLVSHGFLRKGGPKGPPLRTGDFVEADL